MTGAGLRIPAASAPASGLFVSIEGGDAAGKSTQLRLLREHLIGVSALAPEQVLLTREPGGSELGGSVRELLLHGDHVDPRAEALLYAADRAHHVATVIRPHLEAGGVVLCDRYLDSSVAYQGAGRELAADQIRALSLWAADGLLPHRTLLLDVEPAQATARRAASTRDRLESAGEAFHAAVRTEFLRIAAAEPERVAVIDAAGTPEQVHTAIREALAADLARLRPEGQPSHGTGAAR